ncbi:MAG: ankyrin repeat domain-containing protein [Candidatus Micrarchaeia archaeon]
MLMQRKKKSGKHAFERYFMDTVKEGKVEDVKHFIEMGVNINIKDKYGRTALMHAILRDDIEMVRLLIENGADLNATDMYGRTVLEIADENDYEIAEIIKRKMKD